VTGTLTRRSPTAQSCTALLGAKGAALRISDCTGAGLSLLVRGQREQLFHPDLQLAGQPQADLRVREVRPALDGVDGLPGHANPARQFGSAEAAAAPDGPQSAVNSCPHGRQKWIFRTDSNTLGSNAVVIMPNAAVPKLPFGSPAKVCS
jgi:hypothetical protein